MSKLKFRRLTLQYAYLKVEEKEIDEVCKDVEKDIRTYLQEHYPDHYNSFFDPPEKPEEPTKEVEQDTKPEPEEKPAAPKNKDIKKLYRKIAENTHPDKTGNNQYADLFSEAARAYDQNDIGKLLEIAGNLNIELLELSPSSILLLENNIKTLSLEIHNKKNTVAWSWSKSSTDEEKDKLIAMVFKNRGIQI
tara:strand:+ start:1673 stop:2248 length:576 start_codon:yes stop_codon:yes gene_type:complete